MTGQDGGDGRVEWRQVGNSIHATNQAVKDTWECHMRSVKRGLHPVGSRAGKPCVTMRVRVLLISSAKTGIGTVGYNRWRIMPRWWVRSGFCSQGTPETEMIKRVNDRGVSGRECCWPGVLMGVSLLCGRQEMARQDAILTHDSIPS